MALFFRNVFYFLSSFVVISASLALGYILFYKITINDIPAPDLSDSYSYNEKMYFLRKWSKNPDIITVGSSLSLNNLDSKTVTESLDSDSYMNLSSWGMCMKDIFLLLKVQSEIHRPHTLIIVSGIMDFQTVEKNVKYSVVKEFLRSSNNSQILYHLKCFNLKYYISNFKYAQKIRRIPNSYHYLGFDSYGGVNIDCKNFKIDKNRWTNDYLKGKVNIIQYSYLDSISAFCHENKIRFLFFQSPYRAGLFSSFDSTKVEINKEHIQKVKTTLASYQHTFVDANETVWEDRLYIDGTHFNAEGAKLFTKYCFDDLAQINKPLFSRDSVVVTSPKVP